MRGPDAIRTSAILLVFCWIAVALWAVGPTVRESDQASLLQGAFELARNPAEWAKSDHYNYDKQYLSYWLVAGWLKVRGAAGPDGAISKVVREGNLVAVLLWSSALLTAVGSCRTWSGVRLAVLACVLLSPVVAFSGFVVSTNLLSGALILFLAAALRYERGSREEPGGRQLALVGLLAAAAVGARQDAILLMPLIALLTIDRARLPDFLVDRLLWALFAGCLAAMVTGWLVSVTHPGLPSPFFVLPTFVAYVGGGLGAAFILLFLFAGMTVRGMGWRGPATSLAVLLPFLFYGCLLFTPRHLHIVGVGVLITLFLPKGREVWDRVGYGSPGRWVVMLALLGALLPWIVGVRMSGWKSGQPVVTGSTLYPTADGFWPMGAYGWFFSRLASASEEPIDHNQEVWAAWNAVDPELLPEGEAGVLSSGLRSFAFFHLAWWGRKDAGDEAGDFVVFDDRTLAKRPRGTGLSESSALRRSQELLNTGQTGIVGHAMGRNIVVADPKGERGRVDEALSLAVALSSVYGGNDFRVVPGEQWAGLPGQLAGHRAALAARSPAGLSGLGTELGIRSEPQRVESLCDPEPWWILTTRGSDLEALNRGPESLWIVHGTLPEFMDVRRYSGSDFVPNAGGSREE